MHITYSGRCEAMKKRIIIIGSGAAGLSAALELAKNGIKSLLVSDTPSERAQSVMAEGGINAAVDMEKDSPRFHAKETLQAGRNIADPDAVNKMTERAPDIVKDLFEKGMSFTLNEQKEPDVRAFGGQSVKRTLYAASNTGKQLMHTLIDQARRFEAEGIIERMTGWVFLRLIHKNDEAYGCELIHFITQEKKTVYGKLIIASGGLGGLFGNATGSVRNTGAVTANLFTSGVHFANGEFIQYHPTTVKLHGKNMLITEAVRGEGGRLYILRDNKPYYFMEEKYPELGNLMPRDVIAREEWMWMQKGYQIYLAMQHLDKKVQKEKLKGVAEDCIEFLGIDPTKEPIPVEPGIHYFMGGIWVDENHCTSMRNLYAAGECACQYHGANRLGGNSLLGALYGGRVAARSAMADENAVSDDVSDMDAFYSHSRKGKKEVSGSYIENILQLQSILREGLGIVRTRETLCAAIEKVDRLIEKLNAAYDKTASEAENQLLWDGCFLGKAMLMCALERKESRGAHTRSDYPKESPEYQKQTIAELKNGEIQIHFRKAGEHGED